MDSHLDRELDPAMSNYSFKLDEGNTQVSYSFSGIFCPDIIVHFKQFLLSAGFTEGTVADCFHQAAEEYYDYVKDGDKSSFIA
jgi:hypothetical protein